MGSPLVSFTSNSQVANDCEQDEHRGLDAALAQLGEERSHWLALRALTLAAYVLAARLNGATVIEDLNERETAWRENQHIGICCQQFIPA